MKNKKEIKNKERLKKTKIQINIIYIYFKIKFI